MLFCKLAKARVAAIWVLASGLAACAAGPQAELNASAASRIRTIAMLDVAEPTVDLALNLGGGNESHSSSYAQALAEQQIEFSPLLTEAITRQLERSNYQVSLIADRRPVLASDGSIDLSGINTDADAILAVRFSRAGYVSTSTRGLKPWAVVSVQLFDGRSHQRLYAKTFDGGFDGDAKGAVHLPTNPRFQYASYDQLTAKLDDSASGIKDAELAIAAAVGQDFAVGSRPVAGYATAGTAASAAAAPQPMTAAERDRQAAAALAAQWAAMAPPPPVAAAPSASDSAAAAPMPSPSDVTATEQNQAQAPMPTVEPDITAPTAPTAPPETATVSEPAPVSSSATPESTKTITVTEAVEMPSAAVPHNDEPSASVPSVPVPPPAPVAVTRPDREITVTQQIETPASAVPAAPAVEPSRSAQQAPALSEKPNAGAVTAVDVPAPLSPTTRQLILSKVLGSAQAAVLSQRTSVRASPTTRAEIIAVLPAGASVKQSERIIRNSTGSWCFVESGSITGWIPVAAIKP